MDDLYSIDLKQLRKNNANSTRKEKYKISKKDIRKSNKPNKSSSYKKLPPLKIPKAPSNFKKIKAYITRRGVKINMYKFRTIPQHNKIIKYLSHQFVILRKYTKNYEAYLYRNEDIYLPRPVSFRLKSLGYLRLVNQLPQPHTIDIGKTNLKVKGNQRLILKHLVTNCYDERSQEKGSSAHTLVLRTGRGKTFIGATLIKLLKYKTAIIVHNKGMINDGKPVYESIFPNLHIGQYHGTKKEDGDIVMFVINSVVSPKFPREYAEEFGLIILDEVHKYCSEVNQKIFWRFQTRCMLGMTASPDRTTEEDFIFKNHLPLMIAEDLPGYVPDDESFKGHVRVVNYSGPDDHYTKHLSKAARAKAASNKPENSKINKFQRNREMNSFSELLTLLAKDPYRNQLIVKEAIKLYDEGMFAFILTDRLDQADYLIELFQLNGKTSVAKVTGGIKSDAYRHAIENAQFIIGTYQLLDTGISDKKRAALIWGTPRRNLIDQKVGRITRLGSDMNVVRRIIDIVDVKLNVRSQYYNRKKEYDRNGFDIEKVGVDYTEYENVD